MLRRLIIFRGELMKTVNLVGFDDFDADTVEEVKNKLMPFLEKYKSMFGTETIQEFRVTASETRKEGDQRLYELIASLNTTHGDYRVEKQGWDVLAVLDEMESILERQVKEKKERLLKERTGRNV